MSAWIAESCWDRWRAIQSSGPKDAGVPAVFPKLRNSVWKNRSPAFLHYFLNLPFRRAVCLCVRACTQTPLALLLALLRKTQFREGAEGAAVHLCWAAVSSTVPISPWLLLVEWCMSFLAGCCSSLGCAKAFTLLELLLFIRKSICRWILSFLVAEKCFAQEVGGSSHYCSWALRQGCSRQGGEMLRKG